MLVWALRFSFFFFFFGLSHTALSHTAHNALMRTSTVDVRAKPAALPANLSRSTVLLEAAPRYGCRKSCLRPVRSTAVIN